MEVCTAKVVNGEQLQKGETAKKLHHGGPPNERLFDLSAAREGAANSTDVARALAARIPVDTQWVESIKQQFRARRSGHQCS